MQDPINYEVVETYIKGRYKTKPDLLPKRPLQTVYETSFTVFPSDCNYNQPVSIFGGKMLGEMDNCAAMTVRRVLYGTNCTDAVTVGVENVSFFKPAYVGEIVHLKGILLNLGEKSITVSVQCRRENRHGGIEQMAKGTFIFVSRKDGIPVKHELEL